MESKNQSIINQFFAAYAKHDFDALKTVMHEDVNWIFLGTHPLAGVKEGLNEVIAFFDNMSSIMGNSKPVVTKLVSGENENFLIESQHIVTHRNDGNNLDHHVAVLWTFKDGKIIEGRHFFADAHAADAFFSAVAPL